MTEFYPHLIQLAAVAWWNAVLFLSLALVFVVVAGRRGRDS
jgi:hypothetical protein